jgi:carotenoid cleavage dioxygenase-like enzyme
MYRRFLNAWDKGFSFNHEPMPEGAWLAAVQGSVPQELQGTFFR